LRTVTKIQNESNSQLVNLGSIYLSYCEQSQKYKMKAIHNANR